jgi:2-polyprenyl-6-methoxyphenol hydroxylase-like FAD-dependent oxidoreductase
MMVGQDVTEKILDEYLRGIDAPVERSVEVTRTELFDHGARITLKLASGGEDSFEAAWVVGCDGRQAVCAHRGPRARPGATCDCFRQQGGQRHQ